jgi:RNA polymerase sigma-70 factor, ECF subfamily
MSAGHEEQFEELFRYYPAVVKLLLKLDFELEDARDLAQEVFTRVYERMDAYRGESKLAFLQTVARRLAYNSLRDRHARKRAGAHVSADESLEIEDERADTALEQLERQEALQRLRSAVERLPPKEQAAIRFQLSELPLDSIAATLGVTVSALKSRLHTARKRLRDLLGEEPEGLGERDDQ